MKHKEQLLTRRELADAIKVHQGSVTRMERDGMPVAERGRRGKPSLFSLPAVKRWTATRATAGALSADMSLGVERARLARTHAEKVERENKVRSGELLPRALVVREGRAFVKAWRALILALPRQLRQTGVITTDDQ